MAVRTERILSLCSGGGGLDLGVEAVNGMALCAGAGGLELGLHLALGDAYRTVVGVEWEAAAVSVLVARQQDGALPPFPIWDSVATFDGRPWRGVVDIVSGGFPCQPFSVAGQKRGDADPRHLWPHIARIIGECEPEMVFLENVPGLLNTPLADGSGYAYELVERDLLGMGYRVACGLFTAAEVGAPHQRERLFILAIGNEPRWAAAGRGRSQHTGGEPEPGGGAVAIPALRGQRERREPPGGGGQPDGGNGPLADPGIGQLSQPGRRPEGRTGAGPASAGVRAMGHAQQPGMEGRVPGARADEEGWEEPDGSAWEPGGLLADPDSRGRGKDFITNAGGAPQQPESTGAFRLPAFPPGPGDREAWARILAEHPEYAPSVEPGVRRDAHGLETRLDLPRAARLRLTGNGVVPAQAELAFRTLWRAVTP